MVTNCAAEIVRAMSAKGSADRTPLVAAFDVALKRLGADAALSRHHAGLTRRSTWRASTSSTRRRQTGREAGGVVLPAALSPTCASKRRAPTADHRRQPSARR
jgi:hypothetical protein